MVEFQCSHCGARCRVPDGSEGKRGKCPGCGQAVVVPGAASAPTVRAAPAPSPASWAAAPESAAPAANYGGHALGHELSGEPAPASQSAVAAPPAAEALPAEWHYLWNGQQQGPVTLAEMAARIRSGQITASTHVWREGMPDWLAVCSVPQLCTLLPGAAAPIAYAAPASAPGGGKAVASMVLGIIGLLAWCLPLLGFPINLVGLILGITARGSAKRGMAIAGIIMSSIGLAASIVNGILGAIIAISALP